MHLECIMFKKFNFYFLIILLVSWISHSFAASFDAKLRDIRGEINRDNLNKAINLLKKIEIENELQQDKINILFGDIYLKINKPQKAEEFYEKSFFASNENIELLSLIGLAEVRLIQGKLNDAITYSEQAIKINSNKTRPKIILAIAKTRIGEGAEAIKILNDLYLSKKTAEIALAISDYYAAFDDSDQAIRVLEEYLLIVPTHIQVLDQLASLYLFEGDKEKALEAKFKVYNFHEFNKNKNETNEAKLWILSVDPTYFDENVVDESLWDKWKEYIEDEIDNYDDDYSAPNYEQFEFASDGSGSGFIIGKGKYVITNYHVIHDAKRVAVRNGLGEIRNAKVKEYSKKFDLALLKLDTGYNSRFSIDSKTFKNPRPGEDVITIGFPGIGETFWQPTVTQGIVSKVFTDQDYYPGTFMTTIAINSGNSGGPIFNLEGNLVGVAYAALNKLEWIKAGLDEEIPLPTDMGYAIQSRVINQIFQYKQNKKFKKSKYNKADLYEKMLPSVVVVAVLKND